MKVLLTYSSFSEKVRANLARDLLALKSIDPKMEIVYPGNGPDSLLGVMGLMKGKGIDNVDLVIAYLQDSKERVKHSIQGAQYIERDLYSTDRRLPTLSLIPIDRYALKEQGRPNNYNPFDNPMPVNRPGLPTDPFITYFF